MGTTADQVMGARGEDVATVEQDATVGEVARVLADRQIGAVVVTDGDGVVGVLSERDIVRRLAEDGASCLDVLVADAMTDDITTCAPSTSTDQLMATMTTGRFRHVPVVEDDELVGIVSIGDIVKSTIEQLRVEKESLAGYVTGSSY